MHPKQQAIFDWVFSVPSEPPLLFHGGSGSSSGSSGSSGSGGGISSSSDTDAFFTPAGKMGGAGGGGGPLTISRPLPTPSTMSSFASLAESDQEEVARLTTQTMKRSVPPAVPGIHFLSGGMGAEEATQNLQLLQRACPEAPWALSFSFGRALQDAVLKAWAGDGENVPTAQALMLELARVNAEAQLGIWDEEHPSPGAGRLSLPKLSYANERGTPSARNLFNW